MICSCIWALPTSNWTFPIVYTSAINGTATRDINKPGTDIPPLLDTILEQIPAPAINRDAPLQILVLALVHDPYKGKMGIGKILSGSIARRQAVVTMTKNGAQVPAKVTDLAVFSGLERTDVEKAEAGEIVAVAGCRKSPSEKPSRMPTLRSRCLVSR